VYARAQTTKLVQASTTACSSSAMLEQAQQDALDTSNVSSRVETWRRDEPSGIWAYLYIASSNILRDFQHDE